MTLMFFIVGDFKDYRNNLLRGSCAKIITTYAVICYTKVSSHFLISGIPNVRRTACKVIFLIEEMKNCQWC